MRKYIICIIMGIALLNMTACSLFPDGTINAVEDSGGEKEELNIQESRVSGRLSDNITADAVLDTTGIDSAKELKVKEKSFTKEECDKYAALLETADNNITNVQEIKKRDGKILRYIYEYSDGSEFSYGVNMNFRTPEYEDKSYSDTIPKLYGMVTEGKEPYTEGDIDGLSKQKCMQKATQLLESMNIEVYDDPITYTLSVERAEQVNKNGPGKNNHSWDKEDEAYAFRYTQKLSDGKLPDMTFSTDSCSGYAGEVYVIVGRKGVIYMRVLNLYEIVEESPVQNNVDMYAALEKVSAAKQYGDDSTVKSIRYVYVPVYYKGKGELETTGLQAYPYWMIVLEKKGKSEQGETQIKTNIIYINAVDGTMYTSSGFQVAY